MINIMYWANIWLSERCDLIVRKRTVSSSQCGMGNLNIGLIECVCVRACVYSDAETSFFWYTK